MNPNSAAILQFQNTDRDNIKTQMGVRSLIFTAQSSVVDAPYITDRIFDFTEAFSRRGCRDASILRTQSVWWCRAK